MIAVLISAKTEWNVVTAYYAITQLESTPFGGKFSLKYDEEEIDFFLGGYGKIDAAASTQYIIDTYAPALIINFGTCGGFAGYTKAGDILVVDKTLVYDIVERMFDAGQAIQAYATDIDVSWVQDIPDFPVIRSLLVSADRDIDPKDVERLHRMYHAIAGDWESGSIAHICKRNSIPVFIVRGVSDVVSAYGGEAYQSPAIFITRTETIMKKLLHNLLPWITMYRAHRT
ncbi:5'-methylthioadenosine/S-adenosylhomocysteine nucleosidase [Candidatus Vecturithrix granuli]|uniref:5'-methylthioadenosine/S-adenosylhomocysteine nucleosidase n=1 Tax=Vecturithrix granuli TaxID=1499967 RepID=A0A081C126_VECG1|nr:5'-methylthioadenosine/S-adenosylhomocysteine nucleosidase [Candidatus Vecturithrix granuli]